jgi:hypothetical protein
MQARYNTPKEQSVSTPKGLTTLALMTQEVFLKKAPKKGGLFSDH